MKKTVLITGGAGFIGINTAHFFLEKKYNIIILDNFSRRGVEKNIKWFKKNHKENYSIIKYDITKPSKRLDSIVKKADIIFHFAGQVAVTTSVEDPMNDFITNSLGTLVLLESIRRSQKNPILIYSSTNKVYGELLDVPIKEGKTRYEFKDLTSGINEDQGLDFHSPYGCSKGAADQYVRDYSRIYNLRTVVFRQSCIYGPHQYGFEEQGWVAWFMIAALRNKKITIYGNGKQVRDLLYIDDLINAYYLAIKKINIASGRIYNIGGGYKNSISIWQEFGPQIEKLFSKQLSPSYSKVRPGDQMIFIADTKKIRKELGWKAATTIGKGLKKIYSWMLENEKEFE